MPRVDQYTIGPVGNALPRTVPPAYDPLWMEGFRASLEAEILELRRALHAATEALREAGTGGARSVTISGATPNVSGNSLFVCTNGGATTITNFVGGTAGQTIRLTFADANTTLDLSSNANMKGNAGVDFVGAVGASVSCYYDGSVWYCSPQAP